MTNAFTINDVVTRQRRLRPRKCCTAVLALVVYSASVQAESERVPPVAGPSEISQLADTLAAQRQPPEAVLAALLARVQAFESALPRHPDALRGYVDILDFLRVHRNQILRPQQVYPQVIQPGIALGERLRGGIITPEQKQQLARLYFAKGQVLFQDPRASRDRAQEGYESLQQALDLDEDLQAPYRAEYLYRRDVALMILGRVNLEQFEEDGRAAVKIDPKHPGAHFLLGYVHYLRHGSSESVVQRIKYLQEAAQAFTRAIDLLRTQDDACNELPAYYEYRVNAWIKLSEFYTDERTRYLQNAAADAKEALERGPVNLANAHAMHGTALETLAGSDRDRVTEALDAFRQAAKASPRIARYWIAQGRCECKLAVLEPLRAGAHGQAALARLNRILEDQTAALTDAERAEAQYWRGRAYLLDGQHDDRAEHAFAKAASFSDEPTRAWANLALEASAALALDRAERIGGAGSAAAQEYLEHARARAQALSAFKHRQRIVARIRGKAFELEGKPVEALAEYDAELAREEKAQEVADRGLALLRLDLLLADKWRPILQQKPNANARVVQPSRGADGGS